jgi:hypothetical protein
VYGSNKRIPRASKGYFELLCNALEDFTLRVLLVASIVSIGNEYYSIIKAIEVGTAEESHRNTAWIEGFAIFLAVFVCSNVAASNDYSKEK